MILCVIVGLLAFEANEVQASDEKRAVDGKHESPNTIPLPIIKHRHNFLLKESIDIQTALSYIYAIRKQYLIKSGAN